MDLAALMERLVRAITASRRPVSLRTSPRDIAADSSVQLLPANPQRRTLLIQNIGASVIWVGFDITPSTRFGYRLSPAGGQLYMAEPAHGGTIYAFSDTVAGLVVVGEG